MPQQMTQASDAVAPRAGTLPWATRREARLRTEHAALYPGIMAGVWEPGPLFAAIAQDEEVPQSLRSRTRQLAGLLGYDAVDDVDAALAEARRDNEPAPAAAQ